MANNVFVPGIIPFNYNDPFNEQKTITNIVPRDLIPPNTNKLNFQWGKETFKYAYIFLSDLQFRKFSILFRKII